LLLLLHAEVLTIVVVVVSIYCLRKRCTEMGDLGATGIQLLRVPLARATHRPEHLVGLINMLSRTHAELLSMERYSLIEVEGNRFSVA
jgi:hypothetical protein